MDDNIRYRLIITDTSKIAFVVSYMYLAPKIRQRVQRMQIDNDMHVATWEVLKVWLCDSYRETNAALTAELRMNSLRMQYNQRAIDFIADFETLTFAGMTLLLLNIPHQADHRLTKHILMPGLLPSLIGKKPR
ncbi:hypothetical protein ACJ73_09364 [Blastomyces percursus]|uniref:Uncharacterized protein n=1 Tax=Blastomyces percursus TaxID=1658174 RepID=A0A1J9P7F4_9EURO|nr:hypothetical protein ACJ73_09364 [Blastomyces percursus]